MKKRIGFVQLFFLSHFALLAFSDAGLAETVFAPRVDYPTTNPFFLAAGDLDNDANQDLVVANWSEDTVTVFLGSGDGTFAAQSPVGVGVHPNSIATGFMNDDLHLDLAVASGGGIRDVTLLLGDGSGGFSSVSSVDVTNNIDYPSGDADINYLISGDFDGDGETDLALAKNSGYPAVNDHIKIMRGDGAGGFTPLSSTAVGDSVSGPYGLASGNFNGDGYPDLAVAMYDSGTIKVFLGSGGGAFTEAGGSPVTVGTGPLRVVTADLDNNGPTDLAVSNNGNNTISVLLGSGDGTFSAASGSPLAAGASPLGLTTALMDQDGSPDIVVANGGSSTFSLFAGNGDGTFQPRQDYGTGAGPISLVSDDFDQDGLPDVAVANSSGNTLSVFRQTVCVARPDGMVSWWRGEGDATDFVGSLDGTFSAATYAAGMVGQAFSLDGVNDVVDILHPIPSALLGSAPKTVTAWVNPSSHPAEIFMMGNIYTAGASFRLVTNASGHLGFDVSVTVGYSSLVVPVNQWSMVAGTWDGSSYRACLNGTCEVVPGLPPQALAEGLFTIGKANSYFPGRIDEVTLHAAALNETQLAGIANAYGSGICTETDTTPAAFVFTDQTGAAPGSVITSDSITVTGIDFPTDVSIIACTGPGPCEYEINGSGTWLTAPATVMNNDTVAVRQTSSGSYATATDLTLDIGGVSDTFTVTTLNAYAVTANAEGNGSGTVASDAGGISYSYPTVATATTSPLAEGSSITLTATAGTGSTAAWSDCAASGGTPTAATCSFSGLDGDKTVTATFTLNQYTLTYAAGEHGSISGPTPQTVDYGSDGTAVTAVPDANYHFVQWSDGSTANPRTDTNVTGDISVTASFAIDQYTLTYAAGEHGSISGPTPQTVDYGSDGTAVTAVPDANYHFVQWSDGSTANPRTDTNVTGDISVTASFAIDQYTLTVNLAGSGHGTVSSDPAGIDCGTACSNAYDYGTVVTLTATAEAGSRFAGWTGDADCADGTVTMAGDLTCTATFSTFPWIMFNNILTGSGKK